MIKVNVFHNNNEIQKIILEGHAMYDAYGKDIICASVSSIYICTINAILRFSKDTIRLEKQKDKHIVTVLEYDKNTELLLMNMLDLLEQLAMKYPKNIEVVRRK